MKPVTKRLGPNVGEPMIFEYWKLSDSIIGDDGAKHTKGARHIRVYYRLFLMGASI